MLFLALLKLQKLKQIFLLISFGQVSVKVEKQTPLPSRPLSTVNVLLNLSLSAGAILAMLTLVQYCEQQQTECQDERKCNLGHVEFLSI